MVWAIFVERLHTINSGLFSNVFGMFLLILTLDVAEMHFQISAITYTLGQTISISIFRKISH